MYENLIWTSQLPNGRTRCNHSVYYDNAKVSLLLNVMFGK